MTKQDIVVIRYGHRDVRDYRVTSHCALVSRAMGANKIIICGEREENVENTIRGVNETWGSSFKVETVKSWKTAVEELKKKGYKIIHLTMYGIPTQKAEAEIRKHTKIAVLIGSQKVEREVYATADYNVGVTNQPHSEIAALAVFMDRIQGGKELEKEFKGGRCRIAPQENGKRVIALK